MRVFMIASIAIYGLYWAYAAFTTHRIGNYGVETDFYWKYGPAAAGLKEGRVLIEHFDSKGWGYPLVVAAFSYLGLDLFKAGQLVGLLSACVSLWCVFRLHRPILGSTLAFLSMLLFISNPTFVANTYEVGTDMFFLAVALGSIALLLGTERPGWKSIVGSGLLGGWAFTTRYNGLFLLPGAVIALTVLAGPGEDLVARLRRAGLWTAAFFVAAAPWLLVNAAHTGNPLTNNNYMNVGYAVYGGGDWEKFFYGGDRKIHSFTDVVLLDPGRFAGAMVANTFEHLKRDLSELISLPWNLLVVLGAVVVATAMRGRRWGGYLLFGALYFIALVPVFYGPQTLSMNARFSLPMIPFYAALALAPFGWERLTALVWRIERRFPIRIFLFLVLWIPGAVGVGARVTDPRNSEAIQVGPYDTLEAADFLKSRARGEVLFARKPHVAFVAGMRFAPIPQVDSPARLHESAVQQKARYLLVSSAELGLRAAAIRPFADPDAQIPGFRRVFESEGAFVYEVLPDSSGKW